MPIGKVTPFMAELVERLVKEKGVEPATAVSYMRILLGINGDTPYKSLAFLRKKEDVLKGLEGLEKSTQKARVSAIASVLSIQKSPIYKALHKSYCDELHTRKAELMEARGDTMEKTAKEKDKWMDWADVVKRRDEIGKELVGLKPSAITPDKYETLLTHVLLCLYTMMPPRRNKDYQEMFVVKKLPASPDSDKNYLVLSDKKFVFNAYKTAKFSGQQMVDIPAELWSCLQPYLKTRPTKTETRFLVKYGGEPLGAQNAITRLLYKAFGKKVGSSMLRHSYLSEKYGDVMGEMKKDAELMAHTVGEQKGYIRGGGDEIELVG